jgi:rod shape determining protein RodA
MTGGRRLMYRIDPLLVLAVVALVGLGLTVLYSSTVFPEDNPRAGLFLRQLIWLGVGCAALALAAAFPPRLFEFLSKPLFIASLGLLVLVLLVGPEAGGARRWLSLGPLSFQPSEFAKIAYILFLAGVLSARGADLRRPAQLAVPVGAALLVGALVLRQPDLGTALCFMAILIAMLYWAGLPGSHLFYALSPLILLPCTSSPYLWVPYAIVLTTVLVFSRLKLAGLILVVGANLLVGSISHPLWNRLEPYQRERLLTFAGQNTDPYGSRYQILQSEVAIGSGGLAGKGYLRGTQKALMFLPQGHTDFVFAVLGEEMGLLGGVATIALFALLISRALKAAERTRNRFSGLVAVGCAAAFTYHVAVNLLMVVGLAPVTGLPLPFFSYGGSFLVSCLAMVGLVLNVGIRWHDY